MSTKNFIRVVVVAALAVWPGVEVYRYFQAQQQRDAARHQEAYMSTRLAQIKSKHAHMAQTDNDAGVQPVVNKQ
jgi:hypothetical protein